MLSFERFTWGGVRHSDIRYVAFDLEQFVRAPREGSTAVDRRIGQDLIDTLRRLPAEVTSSAAASHLRMIKGNQAERGTVLDILGLCGILQTPDHPGHRAAYIPADQRPLPPRRSVDQAYPVCWWQGRHGVTADALHEFLPALR